MGTRFKNLTDGVGHFGGAVSDDDYKAASNVLFCMININVLYQIESY